MAALRRRGLRVAPFKVGPDFIDPGHHAAAAGYPSHNLDAWLLPPAALAALYRRAAADADVAVVEGVMGLYDGLRPDSDRASTAEVCRRLGLAVVAVLDGYTASGTLAATARGLVRHDRRLTFAGFVLNRLPPGPYASALGRAVTAATGLPVFGAIAPDPAIAVPERHLGLRPAAEGAGWVQAAARAVETGVDVQGIVAAARNRAGQRGPAPPRSDPGAPPPPRARLAVATDEAFHFYYADALDQLRRAGLELVPWSPLRDPGLPADVDGVYLGGGYPELFAQQLADNRPAREAVAAAAGAGLPLWGECGGLMYLCRELVDLDGRAHPMAGVVPARAAMTPALVGMGYRAVRARRDSLLLRAGETARGHEFHWSRLEWDDARAAAERAPWALVRAAELEGPEAGHGPARRRGAGRFGGAAPRGSEPAGTPDGYAEGSVLAGYVHLHLGGDVRLARRLAQACVAARRRRRGR
jgi:cobyrinic acid a,c-diamide synthase